MSFIVKGWALPTTCNDCPCAGYLYAADFVCQAGGDSDGCIVVEEYVRHGTKPEWCPLEEMPDNVRFVPTEAPSIERVEELARRVQKYTTKKEEQ